MDEHTPLPILTDPETPDPTDQPPGPPVETLTARAWQQGRHKYSPKSGGVVALGGDDGIVVMWFAPPIDTAPI